MAREIVTKIWCDPCSIRSGDGDPELSEATEEIVQIGTAKPRLIAVCEVHRKELIDPLREIIKDLPTLDSANGPMKPRSSGEVNTELCKECNTPLKNRSSLTSHVRQIHNLTVGEYREKHEMTEEERAASLAGKVEVKCDQEGCDWTKPATPSRQNQVLGVHKSRAHGIAGTTK